MDKAQRSKVEKAAIDSLLQEGIDFYIDVNKKNILHKIGVLPKQYHFTIKPLFMGTLMRMSKIMIDLDIPDKVSKENWMTEGIELMSLHTDKLLDIVALAIHNSETFPNKKLKRILRKNATPAELLALVTFAIQQMDVSGFMRSIISVKGVSLIKTEETIASGH